MTSIRRITAEDCEKEFETGDKRFDFDRDGKRLDLKFYYDRDKSGLYDSYVLEEDDEIVGVLCTQFGAADLHISRMGVKKGLWRRGFGTKLFDFVLDKALERGKNLITLKAHTGSVAFWKLIEFVVTEEYVDESWGQCYVMELRLAK